MLMMTSSWAVQVSRSRMPLLLHLSAPCWPITGGQGRGRGLLVRDLDSGL